MTGDFCADTAVRPEGPNRWTADIPDDWRVIYAFGGVSMAVAVRAIAAAVDRHDLTLRSAHAVFCAPVPCTGVEIDTEVLRDGRTAAQGRSVLRVAGVEGTAIAATATFGTAEETPLAYQDVAIAPEAGRPDDHEPPPPRPEDAPFPATPFHEQTEWRPVIGTRWWDGPEAWSPGPAHTAEWTRLRVPACRPDGTYDPIALCVPGDALGSAIGEFLGPRDDHFFTVTLELGIDVFAPQRTPWLFRHVRAPIAGDGYGWGTVELFGEDGTLLAVTHQLARLRRFTPGDGFFG
ncbi:MAG: thioesterase family protein [Acidimicrobiales bacterium]|nr:thioesterase family protein [Acidimicrobiales bacterium]MCB1259577.1 thioesterase family protein [Acidimicrobiales bacterium]